jgi:hypothetical protein
LFRHFSSPVGVKKVKLWIELLDFPLIVISGSGLRFPQLST